MIGPRRTYRPLLVVVQTARRTTLQLAINKSYNPISCSGLFRISTQLEPEGATYLSSSVQPVGQEVSKVNRASKHPLSLTRKWRRHRPSLTLPSKVQTLRSTADRLPLHYGAYFNRMSTFGSIYSGISCPGHSN